MMSQIINLDEREEQNEANEGSKAEDLFQRFSLSYSKKDEGKEGLVEDLNKTIKTLRDQNGQLEVQLKLVKKF